jgi:integrase
MTLQPSMTVLNFYIQHFAPKYLSKTKQQTLKTYASNLARFGRFIGREALLGDLTTDQYEKYSEALEKKSASAARYDHRRVLRIVWAYAFELGFVESLPPFDPRMPKPGRPTKYGRLEEIPTRWVRRVTAAPQAEAVEKLPDQFAAFRPANGNGSQPQNMTLTEFLQHYIGTRTDIKQTTRALMMRSRLCLEWYFGLDRKLASITPGEADEFRLHALSILSEATARRLCGRAKQFFKAAERLRLIVESPFRDIGDVSVRANKAREFFVTREMAERVLAACPDNEWRLLFVLCRFGGLRCPSEPLELRWSDVDWGANRIRVPSPKTAYCGKPFRWIPLFPELLPNLTEAHKQAGYASEGFILSRGRSGRRNPNSMRFNPDSFEPFRPHQNLRGLFNNIIRSAGLTPWPKTFQNCRSTRQTELADTYPIHVVCAWIGNTEVVAREHYLQVTDEYFERATRATGGVT